MIRNPRAFLQPVSYVEKRRNFEFSEKLCKSIFFLDTYFPLMGPDFNHFKKMVILIISSYKK